VSGSVPTLPEIRALFDAKGGRQYSGEPVTQLEHALQCARLAEAAGAHAELITACLLHDIGHMTNDLGETPTLRRVDDKHQFHGVLALKRAFPDAVLDPIRLHVDAKRYLCAVDSAYYAGLSADSKRSLELQGGIFSADEAAKFIAQPHAQDAVRLRWWDDQAKVAQAVTPDLAHYLAIAATCVSGAAAA
jgi:phosphonate degradation associated HDIG domain protein